MQRRLPSLEPAALKQGEGTDSTLPHEGPEGPLSRPCQELQVPRPGLEVVRRPVVRRPHRVSHEQPHGLHIVLGRHRQQCWLHSREVTLYAAHPRSHTHSSERQEAPRSGSHRAASGPRSRQTHALQAGPSRSTVRNLHPCPARVHVRGCVLQGTRWQTREVLSPGTQRTGDS